MKYIQYLIYAFIVVLFFIILSSLGTAHAIQYIGTGINPKTRERVLADIESTDVKGEYKIVVFDRLMKIYTTGKMSGKGIVTCFSSNGTKYTLTIVGTVKE